MCEARATLILQQGERARLFDDQLLPAHALLTSTNRTRTPGRSRAGGRRSRSQSLVLVGRSAASHPGPSRG